MQKYAKQIFKFEILVPQNTFVSNPIFSIYFPNKYANAFSRTYSRALRISIIKQNTFLHINNVKLTSYNIK